MVIKALCSDPAVVRSRDLENNRKILIYLVMGEILGVLRRLIIRTDGLAGLLLMGASHRGWNMESRSSLPLCEFCFSGLQTRF